MKKIEKIQNKKIELDKEKEEILQKKKSLREFYLNETKNNKIIISKEQNNRRDDILLVENNKIQKMAKEQLNSLKKNMNSQNKIIANSQVEEQNLKKFLKIINNLQDDSIFTKNEKQKIRIYQRKLKDDKEAKEKELEEKNS